MREHSAAPAPAACALLPSDASVFAACGELVGLLRDYLAAAVGGGDEPQALPGVLLGCAGQALARVEHMVGGGAGARGGECP